MILASLLSSLLLLPLGTFPGQSDSSFQPSSSHVLLVHEYVECLRSAAKLSDAHHLYDESMKDQIQRFEKESELHYFVVPGQDNEPMRHLVDLDAMRYCNWKDNKKSFSSSIRTPQDITEYGTYKREGDTLVLTSSGTYQIDGENSNDGLYYILTTIDESNQSPLMMFDYFRNRGERDGEEKHGASDITSTTARNRRNLDLADGVTNEEM